MKLDAFVRRTSSLREKTVADTNVQKSDDDKEQDQFQIIMSCEANACLIHCVLASEASFLRRSSLFPVKTAHRNCSH